MPNTSKDDVQDVLPCETRAREIVRGCHERLGRPLSPHDLEELIQDTLVEVWKGASSFREEGPRDAWVYGIARFLVLERLRRRRARVGRENALRETDLALVQGDRARKGAFGTSTVQVIRGTLEEAGTTVATIFREHDMDGETFGRIAAGLGMSEAAVKARYYRSLPRLRRQLRQFHRRLDPSSS